MNLADLLAEDPARWERRDAVVAFLDKGLDALKDDRKGRFNLLLGLAGFERAVGRTAAARARLQPLLSPEAPPLSRAQRKRVLDLLDTIALDERARALEDWPAPAPATARAGWRRRRERFEAAERVDDAIRDLEIAVNLAPSNAEAWRALGRLLAAHGGALELDRADEALRQALTLEPAWSDLRELRAQIARRRAVVSAPAPRSAAPSEHARALYQQAEEWIDVGDPIGMGRDLVEEALADSPGFVPPRCRSTRSAARCRRRRSTRSTTTAPGCGRWPTACASWARSTRRRRRARRRPTATRWSAPGSIAPSSSMSRRRGSRGRPRAPWRATGQVRWPISSPTSRASPTRSTWPRRARSAPGSVRRPIRRNATDATTTRTSPLGCWPAFD